MKGIKKGDWVYYTKPAKNHFDSFPPYTLFLVTKEECFSEYNKNRFEIEIPFLRGNWTCISKDGPCPDYYLQEGDHWRVATYEENLKKILE